MAYQSSYTGAEVDAAVASAQTAQQPPAEGSFVDGDKTKLDGVEALADVTDTANVTAAGALMDSEVTNLADVKAFDPTDYATATQGGLADSAVQPADDASGLGSGAATDGYVLTADGVGGAAWEVASGGGGSTDYVRTRAGSIQDLFNMADTWNDGATTFTSIKMNVTDTASSASSLLMDLQVGGSSKFSVSKIGAVRFSSAVFLEAASNILSVNLNGATSIGSSTYYQFQTSAGFSLHPNIALGWGSSHAGSVMDLRLYRDAANTLAQRNGTNAQTFNLYNTYTDASNYERGFMKWNSNVLEIGTEAAGTGAARVVHISGLPTSNPGLGILWNNAGNVEVGT